MGKARPPMNPSLDPTTVDVFVSGHTHLPSLTEIERPDGSRAVMVNSGCFLRQLHPIAPRLKGPPIFVSKFVLTLVRVFARGDSWAWSSGSSRSRPADPDTNRATPLVGRRAPQPPKGAKPRLVASATV